MIWWYIDRSTFLLKTRAFFGHLRLKATPRRSGTVKETKDMAMFMYGIGMSFPIIGLSNEITLWYGWPSSLQSASESFTKVNNVLLTLVDDRTNTCLPRRYTQRDVKAKLPRVDKKVIVQERFTSPWNIAVWMKGNFYNGFTNLLDIFPGSEKRQAKPKRLDKVITEDSNYKEEKGVTTRLADRFWVWNKKGWSLQPFRRSWRCLCNSSQSLCTRLAYPEVGVSPSRGAA